MFIPRESVRAMKLPKLPDMGCTATWVGFAEGVFTVDFVGDVLVAIIVEGGDVRKGVVEDFKVGNVDDGTNDTCFRDGEVDEDVNDTGFEEGKYVKEGVCLGFEEGELDVGLNDGEAVVGFREGFFFETAVGEKVDAYGVGLVVGR